MSESVFIFFPGRDKWRVRIGIAGEWKEHEIPCPANASADEIVSQVSKSLKEVGYVGQPSVLVIPSAWCLAASMATDDLPSGDAKAMLYRLEESLPLAAESVIADFILPEDRAAAKSALGVCVRIEKLQPLIEALELAGISIQSVIPAVLAAAQDQSCDITAESYFLLMAEPDANPPQLNLIGLKNGRPIHWALLPAAVEDVKLQVGLLATEFDSVPHMETMDVDPELSDAIVEATAQVPFAQTQSVTIAAADFAAGILAGTEKPWVEFRRGPVAISDSLRLHRRQINLALAAVVAFFFVLSGVLLFRSVRYGQFESSCDRQMLDAFRQHFPGWQVPMNVKAVIESQHRQAAVASGAATPKTLRGSALVMLHDVLAGLPTTGGYSVSHLVFEDASFEISGELQSYDQVDGLARSARAVGMDVPPPKTLKDKDGLWTFDLGGSRAGNVRSSDAREPAQ